MAKTIFITGSTDGIGKMTAQKLAIEGNEIILHGRNNTKLDRTISELKELSGNNRIKGFVADLSDLAATQNMITEVASTVPKIDVLINNAGVFNSSTTTNKDGLDIRFVVNYLAPFALTEGLIPSLQKGTNARIINLSSAAQAPVSLKALKGNAVLSAQEAYAQSKLAITMWSFALAAQLNDINVVAVNPGSLLNTKMVQEAYGQHWSPVDKGADILCELATSAKHNGVTGKYFDNDQGSFASAHSEAYDDEKIQNLLQTTKDLMSSL